MTTDKSLWPSYILVAATTAAMAFGERPHPVQALGPARLPSWALSALWGLWGIWGMEGLWTFVIALGSERSFDGFRISGPAGWARARPLLTGGVYGVIPVPLLLPVGHVVLWRLVALCAGASAFMGLNGKLLRRRAEGLTSHADSPS